jgi:hypothetical protein
LTLSNSKIPFVFLTAHAFSGSTLAGFLLGTHPEVATVGELTGPAAHTDLAAYPCSCGALLQEDPFWLAVTAVLHRYGLPHQLDQPFGTRFDLGQSALSQRIRAQSLRHNRLERWRDKALNRFWPGHQAELLARVWRNELFARAVLEVTGKSVFLDTSKNPMRIRYLQLSPHIDLYVIHLVRDVRGVVTSMMRRKASLTAKQAAKSWLMRERNVARLLQEVPPDRQITVRYEALVTDTLPTLNRLLAFVGAQPLPEMIDFRSVEQHILGNKMRKNTSSEIRLDERWRTALSPEQLQTIQTITQVTGL